MNCSIKNHVAAWMMALTCLVATAMGSEPYKADKSTVQLWHFDELVGNAAQDVASNTLATREGGVTKGDGKHAGAMQFNGKDGKLVVKNNSGIEIGPGQALTVEAWIKVANHGSTQPVISGSPQIELEVRKESGAISFNIQTMDGKTSLRCTGRRDVADGKWHHVAAIRDPRSRTLSIYVDGKLDAETLDTTLGSKLLIPQTFLIGGNASGTEMFGGLIDELRISTSARDVSKIQDDKDIEKPVHHVLENDLVRITFDAAGSRVYLSGLFDKKRNVEFITPTRAENIWHASMKSKAAATALDEDESKLQVQRRPADGGETLEFTWKSLPISGKANQADVVVTVTLPKDSAMSDWRINLDNRSDEYGLWTARFPRITNLAKLANDGTDRLAIPGGNGGGAGEGQLYKDPFTTMTHPFIRTYPCYHQSMQFNAYYNQSAGLYLATYDGKMNLKGFLIQPQGEGMEQTLLYEVYQYPADAGVAGTGLKQDYAHVVGTFGGDWYDACRMYREWALDQVWASAGPLEKRTDISPWIRDGAYWMVGTFEWEPTDKPFMRSLARTLPIDEARKNVRNFDVEKSVAMVREARDFFGFPLLLWTNEWFDGGGDISPPRYMPMGRLDEYMKQVHKEYPDVYVSGHMQMKRYSVQLHEYDDEVKAAIEFAPNGEMAIEPLDAMDKGDQIAYPCWETQFWQDFWRNKAKEIVSATGLDGFHTDELGSATSFDAQCFNPNHGHPVGGGTMYADSRRRNITMLRDSARTVNPNFAIHHEALSEIYIDRVDLAEVCTAPSNINLPMYEAVYHDYVYIMGRRIHPWMDRRTFPMGDPKYGDNDMNQFVSSFSTTYIWGNQPGWTRLDIVQYSPKVAEYIRSMMRARYRNMKFLNTGQMMRPLTVTSELPTVTNIWTTCDTPEVTQPVILNSTWKASDGTIGIVMANITDQPQTIQYRFDIAETGLAGDQWRLTRTDGETPADIGEVKGTVVDRSDTVEPRSVKIIEIAPAAK